MTKAKIDKICAKVRKLDSIIRYYIFIDYITDNIEEADYLIQEIKTKKLLTK